MSKDKSNKNWFVRHKVLTVIGVIIILIVIANLVNSKSGPTTIDGSNSPTATKPETITEYKVGETVNIDDRQITISDVQRNFQTGNQFSVPEDGKEFVALTVTIANNGDSEMNYGSYDFKMQDSNGVQQMESFVLSDGKLNSGSLAAGGKVTGKLAYQVPKDDAGLKLLFTNPSLFNNKSITFLL